MGKEIGDIIFKLRQDEKLSQKQVCDGLCSVAHFARMEQNQAAIEHFLLDRIFGRLGKSTERLEYVLPKDAYDIYELRYLIQRSIVYKDFEKANGYLKEYESKKVAAKLLHRQFIAQEYAQIAWLQGENIGTVLNHIETAIALSISVENVGKDKIALSADEVKLLLFQWEICQETEWERPVEEIRGILRYIKEKNWVDVEAVQVFPYAVLLYSRVCVWKEEAEYLEADTRKALSLLRDTGKLLYMEETLELYANILEFRGVKQELIEVLRRERNSLLMTEKEYGVSFERFRLFQHINRRFEIDYELIRRMRVERGIPQETLCEGICTQEALSRIENGKSSPRDKVICKLLERMGRKGSKVHTIIMIEDYEVLELKKDYFRFLHMSEFDKASEKLEEIEKNLNGSLEENRQFLMGEKAKIQYHKGEWDGNASFSELKKALQMTCKIEYEKDDKIGFTTEEHCILNEMGVIYMDEQKREEATKIFELQLRALNNSQVKNVFHILEWETAMGNLGTNVEECGEISRAISLSEERARVAMEAGKGNGIGRALITLASALTQEKTVLCVPYLVRGMDLLKLYKFETRYQLVDGFVKSDKFQFKKQFNDYLDYIHHLRLQPE